MKENTSNKNKTTTTFSHLGGTKMQINTAKFPIEVLPDWAKKTVTEVSKLIGISNSYPSGCLLGAVSSLLRKAKVSVRNGWEEPVVLWLIAYGETGVGKSAVFNFIMKPVRAHNDYILDKREKEQESEIVNVNRQIIDLKSQKGQTSLVKDRIFELKNKLKDIKSSFISNMIVYDTDVDSCLEIMDYYDGKLVILSSDDPLFYRIFLSNSGKCKLDQGILSKGFSGDPIYYSRVSKKKSVNISSPNISITIVAYPDMVRKAYKKLSFESEGFLSYFIPFVGEREIRDSRLSGIEKGVLNTYNEKCKKIAMRNPETSDVFTFEPEALDHLFELSEKNTDRFKTFSGNPAIMGSIRRYQSFLSRISVILHVLNNCDEAYWKKPIQKKTVEDAGKVMEEFVFPNIFNCHGLTY
jgi:hypothetical protein